MAEETGKQAAISGPRLPYHAAIEERFGVDKSAWRALTDVIFPLATSTDSIIMALSYCRARNLDVFKRPVHIVPMYDSKRGGSFDGIWPGIGELRTTAFRTGLYAGKDETEFGPDITRKLAEKEVTFPEWARITVQRMVNGEPRAFYGPKVYWMETYATAKRDTIAPNSMWGKRPRGQLEKCAEAAALRAVFPEEIGDQYTADEMSGQVVDGGTLVDQAQVGKAMPEREQYTERPAETKEPAEVKQDTAPSGQQQKAAQTNAKGAGKGKPTPPPPPPAQDTKDASEAPKQQETTKPVDAKGAPAADKDGDDDALPFYVQVTYSDGSKSPQYDLPDQKGDLEQEFCTTLDEVGAQGGLAGIADFIKANGPLAAEVGRVMPNLFGRLQAHINGVREIATESDNAPPAVEEEQQQEEAEAAGEASAHGDDAAAEGDGSAEDGGDELPGFNFA